MHDVSASIIFFAGSSSSCIVRPYSRLRFASLLWPGSILGPTSGQIAGISALSSSRRLSFWQQNRGIKLLKVGSAKGEDKFPGTQLSSGSSQTRFALAATILTKRSWQFTTLNVHRREKSSRMTEEARHAPRHLQQPYENAEHRVIVHKLLPSPHLFNQKQHGRKWRRTIIAPRCHLRARQGYTSMAQDG